MIRVGQAVGQSQEENKAIKLVTQSNDKVFLDKRPMNEFLINQQIMELTQLLNASESRCKGFFATHS